jgi:phage terminase large subunit-like protein
MINKKEATALVQDMVKAADMANKENKSPDWVVGYLFEGLLGLIKDPSVKDHCRRVLEQAMEG